MMRDREVYNIAVAPNRPYVKYMLVLLESVFESNAEKTFCFYILYNELNERDRNVIEQYVKGKNGNICFVYIDRQPFEGFPLQERFSIETYFRLVIQDVMPENIKRVLYLDCDMIVIGDIEPLYHVDMEGKYFAACGFSPRLECGDEFNAGMILYDMDKMREDIALKTYRGLLHELGENYYQDQALLNAKFAKDGVKYVWKQKYNFTCPFYRKFEKEIKREMPEYSLDDVVIVHFAGPGIRPWQMRMSLEELKRLSERGVPDFFAAKGYLLDGLYVRFLERWWNYAGKTPCYEELLTDMQREKAEICSGVLLAVADSKEYRVGRFLLRIPKKLKKWLARQGK